MYYSELLETEIIQNRIKLMEKENLKKRLQDKSVLVTGGAGTVGRKLCEKLLEFDAKKVIVLDNNELSIFNMSNDLAESISDRLIDIKLGSVLDNGLLEYIFRLYSPNIVIHAAAYKHVSIADKNPAEAVKCNVQGTLNILNFCKLFKVENFVYLSSDKAVNPSSIMGVTKRIGELLVRYFNMKTEGNYSIIRFGNVFGSSGSVGQIFVEQIVNKKKLTITHPDMERYFMSLNDAVNLIISSIALYETGEIFICDMKQSIKIVDLAKRLILALGYTEQEIEIQYSNIREGESLFEELSYPYEVLRKSAIKNIMICDSYNQDKNENSIIEKVYNLMQHLYSENMIQYITDIVPEYKAKKENKVLH